MTAKTKTQHNPFLQSGSRPTPPCTIPKTRSCHRLSDDLETPMSNVLVQSFHTFG